MDENVKNLKTEENKSKYQYVTVHQKFVYKWADVDKRFMEEERLEIPLRSFPCEVLGNDIRISDTKENAQKDVEYFMDLYGTVGVKSVNKVLHCSDFDTIRIRTEWYHSKKHDCKVQELHVIDTHVFKNGVAI